MEDPKNSKPKLKPANKYKAVSKEKVEEVKAKMIDISSSVGSAPGVAPSNPDPPPETPPKPVEQTKGKAEDAEVVVPTCQPTSESSVESQPEKVADPWEGITLGDISVGDFCTCLETTFLTTLNNRETAAREARQRRIEEDEAKGITVITPENALTKCVEFMKAITKEYNLYGEHKNSIAQQQTKSETIANKQAENLKRIETLVGRIEKVQGVKSPKKPPFPSWECLAYLLWHWPMYAFAYLWLSKYFRRFCFLIAFLVIVIETCTIGFLACDNSTFHHERMKYYAVRNWSLVSGDTAVIHRFNYVDKLFDDVEFYKKEIKDLDDLIRTKHEKLLRQNTLK